ncbi:hypothetical protein [Lapillicoccus sp.]|uniref:hypothetical protein n=1 Tax=Lapillicoccus sp. TaxID=1909287 RepID=UPI0025FBD994|nr:hypothetical protein [Lapillicoccus sp.]
MTTLTLTTLLLVVFGAVSRRGYGTTLALGGATAAGAAFVAGNIAVPTFYATAIGTVVALFFQMLTRSSRSGARRQGVGRRLRTRLPPGASLLVAFAIVATFVTLTASTFFDGLAVRAPAGSGRLQAAAFTSSNIAQVGYLVIGVCVVVFLARSSSSGPELVGLAAGTTLLLSAWRYLHTSFGAPFPENFFDNTPFFAYIETAPGAVERFRGVLSEPSALAGTCLVVVSYLLSRQAYVTGWRRAGAWVTIALAVFLGAISTSTTFVVAGVVTAGIATGAVLYRFLFRRLRISSLGHIGVVGLLIASIPLLPVLAGFVLDTISGKVVSSSYSERSGADSSSYLLVLDTFGYGAGLGSNRAASFLPGMLSTTGIVGTVLFTAAVVLLIRKGYAVTAYRPVVWALVSVLVAKLIAGPDLSDPSGVLWLCLGLLSNAAVTSARPHLTAPLVRQPRPVPTDPSRAASAGWETPT